MKEFWYTQWTKFINDKEVVIVLGISHENCTSGLRLARKSDCVRRLFNSKPSEQKPTNRHEMCTWGDAILDYSLREKFTCWTRGNMVGDWLPRSLALCLFIRFHGSYFERNHFIEIRRPLNRSSSAIRALIGKMVISKAQGKETYCFLTRISSEIEPSHHYR